MSKRIARVNQLIKEEISQIILRDFDLPKEVLVTVTRVESSANLIQAKVFVSCFPEEKSEEVLKILKNQVYPLQQKLNKKLRMRPVPQIIFIEEKKTVEAGRIEEILEGLKKKKK